MIKEYLEIGKITGTHGVRGEMRVQPWCDGPEFMKKFKTLYLDPRGEKALSVSSRPHGAMVIMKAQDIDTVEKAAAMRGRILYMKRSDAKLPEGHWFIQELIGCRVVDADDDSICYGELSDVSETGANDVWHITRDGKEYLIPAIPSVVIKTDVEAEKISIRPLKGIFDDEN